MIGLYGRFLENEDFLRLAYMTEQILTITGLLILYCSLETILIISSSSLPMNRDFFHAFHRGIYYCFEDMIRICRII